MRISLNLHPIIIKERMSTEDCACNLVCLCSKTKYGCNCVTSRDYCEVCEQTFEPNDSGSSDDDDDDDAPSKITGYLHADGKVEELENDKHGKLGWKLKWFSFEKKDYEEATLVFKVSY
jgi:hypothetical protein